MGQHSSSALQAEVQVSPSLVSGALLAAGLSLYLASEEVVELAYRSRALPDSARLAEVLAEIRAIAGEWQARYPGGRYLLAERLGEWLDIINQ